MNSGSGSGIPSLIFLWCFPPLSHTLPFTLGQGEEERGITLCRNRSQDPEHPLISLSALQTWHLDEDIPNKRTYALRWFNYCLYSTHTFLSGILLFICHSRGVFFSPIFSQRLESVLPMLAFISLAFLSMGKHGIEGNPSPQTLYLPGRF